MFCFRLRGDQNHQASLYQGKLDQCTPLFSFLYIDVEGIFESQRGRAGSLFAFAGRAHSKQ